MTPEQIADRESKFALKLVDSSAKQFTVGTPIDIGDGFDIKPLATKFDSFFYHSETKKTKICLHFTVGVLPGDIATLTKENNHMSVQYVVDGLGNTYGLFDDAYWSYHLGAKAVGGNADMSKQSIGIEISNYGPLTSKEGKFLDAYGNVFTSDVDFVDEINYRGYYFYAKMTDRQIDAVAHLLVYLCQKHMIPIEFKEDGRVEGRINTNDYSGYYLMPHMMTIDGKRDGYNGYLHYGLINLANINVTEVADDEPMSKTFMRIFNATEIKIWSQDIMTIKNSEGEIFGFFRENIKEIYGYK